MFVVGLPCSVPSDGASRRTGKISPGWYSLSRRLLCELSVFAFVQRPCSPSSSFSLGGQQQTRPLIPMHQNALIDCLV
jgi:hypothetical protein